MNIGDEVTVGGKIIKIENGCLEVELSPTKNRIWIEEKDIKTVRNITRLGECK